ncbi:hypothetical protein [Sphingobacterium wenxiniae]|uniref:Transposase n=1 Tax=Sphingobacterium wenxiniae TaxID=683125 RepID=A0A1I6ST74_9SPHI|nr:hypothetical protein [Sphingobacterium wenxiniae]SFS80117.1 hypothetical protein SAMN05660206_10572 [Sphingobacterium wenxiniae]
MRKLFFIALVASFTVMACQNSKTENNEAADLAKQAIDIHDEIMPQIALFDRRTVLIDSLLGDLNAIKSQHPDVDTVQLREQLSQLKIDLEIATDNMMLWMREYEKDSTDVSYQEQEVQHMMAMKAQFQKVTNESDSILPNITQEK